MIPVAMTPNGMVPVMNGNNILPYMMIVSPTTNLNASAPINGVYNSNNNSSSNSNTGGELPLARSVATTIAGSEQKRNTTAATAVATGSGNEINLIPRGSYAMVNTINNDGAFDEKRLEKIDLSSMELDMQSIPAVHMSSVKD